MKKYAISAALLFLMLNGCSSDNKTEQASVRAPKWVSTTCQQDASLNDPNTECGYLIVPENRNDPNSRDIKVYATIIHNPNAPANATPCVYLTGGPGAPTADAVSLFELTSGPYGYFRQYFGDNRDIVILDQRGTNRSLPALYCSQELRPGAQAAYSASYKDAADNRIPLSEACYSRLANEGIDLSGYNSIENATDVRDLAAVLGYQKINIYAASYGTRLAMVTMKLFPEVIETVVLDSVLPPELNPYEKEVDATLFALSAFYEQALPKYPLVKQYVEEMMAELAAHPVTVSATPKRFLGMFEKVIWANRKKDPILFAKSGIPDTEEMPQYIEKDSKAVNVTVDGTKFLYWVIQQLKTTPYVTNLPTLIYSMRQDKDYTAVANNWTSTVDFFWPEGGAGTAATAIGMYNSVFGANDAYYSSPEKVEAEIGKKIDNPVMAEWLRNGYIRMEPALQGKWPVQPVPESLRDPVVSAIPTMLFVGTLDQATPSIFSEPSTVTLYNSFYYRIIAGHATAYNECVVKMIDDFYKSPYVPPNNSCPTTYDY